MDARDPGCLAGLSPRQREVAYALRRGLSNKLIARELGIAPGTVKVHMFHVSKALDASSRYAAIALLWGIGPDTAPEDVPVRNGAAFGKLTRREQEVARLMACGLSNGRIAERKGLSVHTATDYVRKILRKLHACCRSEAVVLLLTDPSAEERPAAG